MMNQSIARKSALVTRLLVVLLAALVLAGCTRGMSDLRAWVAQEKAKKGAPIPPLPVIKTFETFKYEDQDKRDPFSPSTAERALSRMAWSSVRPTSRKKISVTTASK